MTHLKTETRRITPENIDTAYDWGDDPEVKKEIAREQYLKPQINPEIMAAMQRAAEREAAEAAVEQPVRPTVDATPEVKRPKHRAENPRIRTMLFGAAKRGM